MQYAGTLEAVLASFLKAIIIPYEILVNTIWNYTMNFGLSPGHAFLSSYLGNQSYSSLLDSSSRISLDIISPIVVVASVYFLVYNNIRTPINTGSSLYKASLILFASFACTLIWLEIFGELGIAYTYFWEHSGIANSALLPISAGFLDSSFGSNSIGSVLEFLLITAYFGVDILLLSILAIRQALLLLILPILPVFTMLSLIGYFEKYARVLWEIILEFSIFPFLALLSVYLSGIFSSYVPLQLAFLALPSLIPGYMFFSGRGPSHTPFMNLFGSLAAGSVISSTFGYSRSFSEIVSGDFRSGVSRLIQLPSGNSASSRSAVAHKPEIDPYREAVNEELKNRRHSD